MEHYSTRTHQRSLEVDNMCNCKEVHLEELEYDENRWNYLPIHKTCGKYVSREQCVELVRRLWINQKRQK